MSAEEAKEGDKKDDKPSVGTMKRGDYMIHVFKFGVSQIQVFIELCRQIKVPDGETVDPIIQLECMGEKKYTSAKDDIGSTGVIIWNEHIFFEPKNVTVPAIEQAKICIRLQDKGTFKDALIGMYEFDVAYVYFMEQHLLLHKWIALSDPSSKNFNEVTGYLKLSISVAASGDEQVQITEEEGGGDDSVMMPPAIRPEFYQLKFRFYKGEKLPIMDTALFGKGGSIDAYVICNYLNQKLKTKTVTMKNDIVFWNQEFLLPVQMPIMSSRLVMQLFDEDKLSDEIVGSMIFNLKDYIDQKATEPTSRFFWKNIYGSPLGCSGANTNLMNSNPDLASTWKGRILMEVTAEKTEKPEIKLDDIEDELIKERALAFQQPHEYEIMCEVGQGIALPDANKYTVKIKVADQEFRTEKPVVTENTYNRWNQRFPKTTFTVSYQDAYDMGKVYVYLMEGEKAICYAKDEISKFMDPDPKMRWYELTPDLAIGKVKEPQKAGLVSFKLSVHDKTLNGPLDFTQYKAWRKPPPKRPANYKIRAFLYQCRDLPAADADGQSDPYIVFWDQSKVFKQTKVIEDNVNPLYYETIELSVEANSFEELPPFILDIFDKDFNPLDSDDFICRALIYPHEAHMSEDNEVPKPKWHSCRLKAGAPESGQVLISFSVVADDFSYKTPLNYMNLMETVQFDDYQVEISILGLRGLQSVGILPVKKAFIQFSLKSLVPPNCSQKIDNIKTQPGPAGSDPTINTMIKFTIPLPNDPLYCPRLQCQVYDNIFKSFMQPLLGVFIIPIGEILFKKQQEKQDAIFGLRHIISELTKILDDQGVLSYNIPEQKILVEEDQTFRSEANKQKQVHEEIVQAAAVIQEKTKPLEKSIIKEKKESLFQPLLLNLDSDEKDSDLDNDSQRSKHSSVRSSPALTPRRTPRSIIQENMSMNKSLNAGSIKSAMGKSMTTINGAPSNNGITPYNGIASNRSATPMSDAGSQRSRKKSTVSALNNSMNFFNKVTDINRSQLIRELKEEAARMKRDAQQEIEISVEEMKRQGNNPYETTVLPQYQLDELLQVYREINMPPDTLYIGLGFDEIPEDNRKHYRRYYIDELENVTDLMAVPSPFDTYNLKRGQTRGASKSLWPFSKAKEDDSGAVNTEQIVGKFKCIIDIHGEKEKQDFEELKAELIHELKTKLNQLSLKKRNRPIMFNLDEQLQTQEGKMELKLQLDVLGLSHLNITNFLQNMEAQNTLKKLLMGKNKMIVRLYMISAYDLSAKDNDSPSDPYLVITLGDKNYNECENYQLDEANPNFHKMYDFEAYFPGCPLLVIKVFDYDELFGDDLIGETKIDLEDRFFSSDWQQLEEKPIEYRQIYHPSSSISQGVIKLWAEIIPANAPADALEPYIISLRPPEIFEVRVCVFDTLDIKMMDAEGTSDAYIRGFFDSKEESKETDTHFRCQDGKASFNYRWLFTTSTPRKDYNFNIQAYDRDFFKSNDIIGEGKVNLKQVFEDCTLTKRPISINKSYVEKCLTPKSGVKIDFKDDNTFWVQLSTRNEKGQIELTGKIRIQIDVLPKDHADLNKVGEARQEPNLNPFLPPPVGRLSFSLNPLKMFQQMVGPAMRRKIYCFCCCALCCMILLMVAPMLISNVFTAIIMAPFS